MITDPMERAVSRALLSLGDMGGPVVESRAILVVTKAAAKSLIERGLLEIHEPVYILTDEGLRQYAEVSARRNAEADR